MILIAWMGSKQIVASGNNAALGLTTGDLTALVTYAMQILMAMMMLSMVFVMCIISQASAERICQVLNEESTVTEPGQPHQGSGRRRPSNSTTSTSATPITPKSRCSTIST